MTERYIVLASFQLVISQKQIAPWFELDLSEGICTR